VRTNRHPVKALNGGYFARNPATGEVRQWQTRGSGSEALLVWIAGLRARGPAPGVDQILPLAEWRAAVDVTLEGIPGHYRVSSLSH
jgi:hypothetical protein